MKKNLVIFPEIISGVIRNNELDIFLIWQCSKLIPSSEKQVRLNIFKTPAKKSSILISGI